MTHHVLGTEGHKLKVSQKPNIDSVTQHESLIEIKLPMKELYAFWIIFLRHYIIPFWMIFIEDAVPRSASLCVCHCVYFYIVTALLYDLSGPMKCQLCGS